MKHILVVCAAGASSTFLAHRMRKAAKARGFEATVKAVSQSAIESRMPGIDVLLVGPHLAADLSVLTENADSHRVPIALLPETIFGTGGEDQALDIAIRALQAPASHPSSAPTTTENHS